MNKRKFLVLLVGFFLLFNNTVEAAAYDQQFRSVSEKGTVSLSRESKESQSETKPEVETIEKEDSMMLYSLARWFPVPHLQPFTCL